MIKPLLAAAALLLGLTGASASAPTLAGCPVFPASNPWNQKVDTLPVAANSAQLIASMGSSGVHADFGNGLYNGSRIGIPYVVVHAKTTPKSPVTFEYADESDKGPYPIPKNVPVEGYPGHADQGDRHVLIVDRDACKLHAFAALAGSGQDLHLLAVGDGERRKAGRGPRISEETGLEARERGRGRGGRGRDVLRVYPERRLRQREGATITLRERREDAGRHACERGHEVTLGARAQGHVDEEERAE